jgi:CheY-like chemotaxis protein
VFAARALRESMSKKILLIESDLAFARSICDGLEHAGFETRAVGDGKEGLELATDWAPGAVVLCVELPKMSGYVICQKLKKDDALKAIPLVLTSSEATPETFEKHRQLKVRADDYLIKPYDAEALVEKLGALVGLPERPLDEPSDEAELEPLVEEVVSLEEEPGLDGLAAEPDADLPALDLDGLPDEPVAGEATPAGDDEDLRLLDDAFDGLAAPAAARAAPAARTPPPPPPPERALELDDVDAAAALLERDPSPGDDDVAALLDPEPRDDDAVAALLDREAPPDDGVAALLDAEPRRDEDAVEALLDREPPADHDAAEGEDAELALDALGDEGPVPPPEPSRRPALRGASAHALRAAGIRLLDDAPRSPATTPAPGVDRRELDRLERDLAARDATLRDLRAQLEDADQEAREAADARAELDALRERADAATAQARKAEAELRAARDEARRSADEARAATDEAEELRRRLADAEEEARRSAAEAAGARDASGKVEALEREVEDLKTELVVARGEADGAQEEVEKRTAELRRRVAELEASSTKNEERVLKAYQKIKGDERVREKVRKALAVAAQLLDEGAAAEVTRPRASAADE